MSSAISTALERFPPFLLFIATLDLLSCRAETNYLCDFESGSCEWQTISPSLNLTIHQGAAPSNCSGPPSDYTTNNSSGHYLLFDPSSSPNDSLWSVMVYTPILLPASADCQLQFQFSMKGPDVGNMTVVQEFINDSPDNSRSHLTEGSRGEDWTRGVFPMYSTFQKFRVKIVFRHRASGPCGLIAIDDTNFMSCLKAPTAIAHKDFPTGRCDFDKDYCDWYDSGNAPVEWTRRRGQTTTSSTGPPGGYNLQTNSDYYVYYEASQSHEVTTLSSAVFNRSSFMCSVSFAYHMSGASITDLNVTIYRTQPQQRRVVWTKTGNQGTEWRRAFILLGNRNGPFQVEMTTSANGSRADTALDVITFTNCNPDAMVPNWECDFTDGMCNLSTAVADSNQSTWRNILANTAGDLQCSLPTADHSDNTNGYYLAVTDKGDGSVSSLRSGVMSGCSFSCFFAFSYFINATESVLVNVTANGLTSGRRYTVWRNALTVSRQWETVYAQLGPINERFILNMSIELTRTDSGCRFLALDDVQFYNSSQDQSVPLSRAAVQDGGCNFEEGNTCFWYNMQDSNDGDWVIGEGFAPSAVAGPIGDTTLGSELGHYLYSQAVDSSIASSSVLTSAVYNTSAFSCFLSFAYNLHGTGSGLLAMYINTQGEHLANWKATSNTKPLWRTTKVHVGRMNSPFQVIFNASHNPGTDDVMALDDVTFHGCQDDDNACDWEEGWCPWWRNADDVGVTSVWERRQALNVQDGLVDVSLSTTGHVAYFNFRINSVAVLESVPLSQTQSSSNCRLSFSYYMHGDQVGTLTVGYRTKGGDLQRPISWTGNQGDLWHTINIRMAPIGDEFSVRISAQKVSGYDGVIVVDDLRLRDCTPVLQCPPSTTADTRNTDEVVSDCWSRFAMSVAPTPTVLAHVMSPRPHITPDISGPVHQAVSAPSPTAVMTVPVDDNCNCVAEVRKRDAFVNATNAISALVFVLLLAAIGTLFLQKRKSLPEQKPGPGKETKDNESIKVADSELYYDRLEMGRCYGLSSKNTSAPVVSNDTSSHSAAMDSAVSNTKSATSNTKIAASNTKRKTSTDHSGVASRYETVDRYETTDTTSSESPMARRASDREIGVTGPSGFHSDVDQSAASPPSNMAARMLESQPLTSRRMGDPPRASPLVSHMPSARHRSEEEGEENLQTSFAPESRGTARHTDRKNSEQRERQQYPFQMPFQRDFETEARNMMENVERGRKYSLSQSREAEDVSPSRARRPLMQHPPSVAVPQVSVLPTSLPSTDEDEDAYASGTTATSAASANFPERSLPSPARSDDRRLHPPAVSERVTSEESEGDRHFRSARWSPRSSPEQQRGRESVPPHERFRARINSRPGGMGQTLSPAQLRAMRRARGGIQPSHDKKEETDGDDDQ